MPIFDIAAGPTLAGLGIVVPGLALAFLWKKLVGGRIKLDLNRHVPGLKVVITGGSKGLGFSLARQFLLLGDDVVVTSRSQSSADNAARKLSEEVSGCKVVPVACDVTQPSDLEGLKSVAVEQLGGIDIWINNAGMSSSSKVPVAETSTAELQEIVQTNLLGPLMGSKVAISQMLKQERGGKVFLVDGAGSRGDATPGNAAYGSTKAAMVQLKNSLAAEVKGTIVAVHLFSPGMVATGLLLRYASNPRSAKFINILAEDSKTVAAWLVPRIRGVAGNGAYFKFLTLPGVLWRFVTAKSRKGRFVLESGSPSVNAGYERLEQ